MLWAREATWYIVSEYAVAWNLAENDNCLEIALEFIKSDDPKLQVVGWSGMSSFLLIKNSEGLNVNVVEELLEKAENEL